MAKFSYPDKFARHPADVPDVEHWAIITQGRYSEAGYNEGDPSTPGYYADYEVYLTKEK